MAHLDELKAGIHVAGLIAGTSVVLEQVQRRGTTAVTITFRDQHGNLREQLVYPAQAATLQVVAAPERWQATAPGAQVRLVAEAQRIRLAHLFDPLLAVHLSQIEPLPHQITAVYGELVPRQPLRYLLADDPGAGKTIMAGLLIKELHLRSDVQRCLIVCPGSLVEQWQDELASRFQLLFDLLTRDGFDNARANWFEEHPFAICRLDHLSRNEELQTALQAVDWDLVIFDEAHKLSASYFGGDINYTKRYQLGQRLAARTRHLLLLTATPHNGKEEDFQLFLKLLDVDRFEGRFRDGVHQVDTSDLMRRLVKEQLLRFDGTPLFPERLATTVPYALSAAEQALYEAITEYVRREFDRADMLNDQRRGTVGFALTILQRRLASSPEAIYRSLSRRRERLTRRLQDERHPPSVVAAGSQTELAAWSLDDWDTLDDLPGDEFEAGEELVVDQATAARTIAELEIEIAQLAALEAEALAVRRSNRDTKWDELSRLLQSDVALHTLDGTPRKLVIFTEHRDTLTYLLDKIRGLLGRPEAVVAIHGSLTRSERKRAETTFKEDPAVQVLVATDAAGEGINLQRAHLMVNYDLPWNPNRLEQRFGRIHRIGQTEVCHMWNLVAADTREGAVYERLLHKLETERAALGGRVFNVLGKLAFDNRPLRELLLEAVRYGDQPDVRARLSQAVDNALDRQQVRQLLRDRALSHDTLNLAVVQQVRADMERAQAQRLQPHFIATFFIEAFRQLGGAIRPREAGRYEITNVPALVRQRAALHSHRNTLPTRYERVTFAKETIELPGKPTATLICPGQPLLDVTIELVLEHGQQLLNAGAVLVDPADLGTTPRVLFAIDHLVSDGQALLNGTVHTVSQRWRFVEIDASGHVRDAGTAPYLDYRPLTPAEQTRIGPLLAEPWLMTDLAAQAEDYAIEQIVPAHLAEVQNRVNQRIAKVRRAVHERLTKEIMYWDARSVEFAEAERHGRTPRINAVQARQRVQDLQERLERRMLQLDQEAQLAPAPPRIASRMVIVPVGWLLQTMDQADEQTVLETTHNRQVELRAVAAVMQAEQALGYQPTDLSAARRGYDIESLIPHTGELRLIEVKGRVAPNTSIALTRNEILTALNARDTWWLALVNVPDDPAAPCEVRYLRPPFSREPEFGVTSVTYNWHELWDKR